MTNPKIGPSATDRAFADQQPARVAGLKELAAVAAHTPGPWRVNDPNPNGVYTRDGRRIVENYERDADADLRLIAAAPEMLDALRRLEQEGRLHCAHDVLNPCFDNRPTDVIGRHWGGGKACAACTARAAIAKATGADDRGEPVEDGSDDGRCTRFYPSVEGDDR